MIRCSNEEVINLIKNHNDISELNVQDNEWGGYTPLHYMIERLQIEIIKDLLELGVDTSIKTHKGYNARDFAISYMKFHQENLFVPTIIDRYKEIIKIIEDYEKSH